MMRLKVQSLARCLSFHHLEMSLTSCLADLMRANLTTMKLTAFGSFVREWSLDKEVAGVTISLTISFISTID